MKFNFRFNVGDIIHQTKDNLVFLVIAKDKKHIHLEYYDSLYQKSTRTLKLTREQLKNHFTSSEGKFLIHIKVCK